jgi:TonB-linked SusC/RagA family outer membrane protein
MQKALCAASYNIRRLFRKNLLVLTNPGHLRMKSHHGEFRNIFLVMNLTAIILLSVCLTAHAGGYAQKITLSLKDASLEQVFREIKKQTSYSFVYYVEDLSKAQKVTLEVSNAAIEEVLQLSFKNQPLTYTIVDRNIVIKAKQTLNPQPAATLSTEIPLADIIGRITNEQGEPISNANVILKRTGQGTVTNAKGEFSLHDVRSNDIIIISSIGYKTLHITPGNKTDLALVMETATDELNNVVVTALGITKQKKAVGFATQELAKKDLADAREVSVANYLTGKIAGVQVSLPASGVGGSSKVLIRGISSLSGENQPLYVVDGVPLDNTKYAEAQLFTMGRDYGDGIGNINPQDIESVNVLKGPNATALYGSRGSNGVILITTKSGKAGKGVAVEVNSNVTIDKLNLFPKLQNKYMTGYEDINLYGGSVNIDGVDYLDIPTWHYESMGPPMDGRLLVNPFVFDPSAPPTTFKLLPQPEDNVRDFFETGVVTNNSVAFSGGTEKSSARLSVNNTTIKGIIPNHDENQQSISLRAATKVTDKLSFEGKVNYLHKKVDNAPGLGVFSQNNVVAVLAAMGRYVPMPFLKEYYERTGEAGVWPGVGLNPYFFVNEVKNNAVRERIISFVSVKYQFTDWLTLMARSGVDQYSERRVEKRPVGTPGFNSAGNFLSNGFLVDQTYLTKESNSDILLTASKDNLIKNFSASLSVGGYLLKRSNRAEGWEGTNFKVPGIYHVSNARDVVPNYRLVNKELQSVYFSGEIGYKEYLFFNVTGRNDWSSTLGDDNYSFFYPSVSTSFVFTDAFKLNSKVLTFGKVRASYALAGNDADAYLTQSGYFLNSTAYNGQSLAYPGNTIALFDLKNELKRSVEFGADLRFFGDRIGLDATFYKSNNKNQIIPITISAASGYTTKVVNAGNIENKGIEISLRATPVQLRSGFHWDLSFNYARNQSKVIELAPGLETFQLYGAAPNTIEARIGQAFGNIVGYKYRRAPDGQKIVGDDGSYGRENDLSILGNVTPEWVGGLNNSFSFKGFSLNFLIDFVQGNQITSSTRYRMIANGTAKFTEEGREHSKPLDGVVEVKDANGNVIKYEKNTKTVDGQTYWSYRSWGDIGEEFVLDGSFVMLREVVLGYGFQPSFIKKTPFKSLRLSLVGRNLWYIEEHMQGMGISPETNLNTQAGATGVEAFTMPTTRSYGINLNLTF